MYNCMSINVGGAGGGSDWIQSDRAQSFQGPEESWELGWCLAASSHASLGKSEFYFCCGSC